MEETAYERYERKCRDDAEAQRTMNIRVETAFYTWLVIGAIAMLLGPEFRNPQTTAQLVVVGGVGMLLWAIGHIIAAAFWLALLIAVLLPMVGVWRLVKRCLSSTKR